MCCLSSCRRSLGCSLVEDIDRVRGRLKLEQRELSEIVFSSADTPEEAEARELSAFEAALVGELPGEPDLAKIDLSDLEDLDDFEARLHGTDGSSDVETHAQLDDFDAQLSATLEDEVEIERRGVQEHRSLHDRK